MIIIDWSSDVCSSDLRAAQEPAGRVRQCPQLVEGTQPMRQISFREAVPALLISASALGACTTTSAKPRATVQEAPREVLATPAPEPKRSEEHTSELQSLMRISYAVSCLHNKTKHTINHTTTQ